MKSTSSDFWTMIWEKKSYVIVMLGQLNEDEEVYNKINHEQKWINNRLFIRRFVISIGLIKNRNVNLENLQLKQL